jgi:hypothetical protein
MYSIYIYFFKVPLSLLLSVQSNLTMIIVHDSIENVYNFFTLRKHDGDCHVTLNLAKVG